jgi:excisionase family DNA binding protein
VEKVEIGRSFSVRDVARRYRVGRDKVRGWIARGELRAVNVATARSGKGQYRITATAIADFEKVRSTVPLPSAPRRRTRQYAVDYFPD